MTRSPQTHNHANRGSGGTELRPTAVGKVQYVDTIDEITDRLTDDPGGKPALRMEPGSYSSSAVWKNTLQIPGPGDGSDFYPEFVVDMTGVQITLDETPPDPMVDRVQSGDRAKPIYFNGPQVDATGISNANLGTYAEWNDVQNAVLRSNFVRGEFDVLWKTVAENGSGHQNRHQVYGRLMDKGIVINDGAATQSDDRSEFFGQLTRIGDVGVEVVEGDKNYIHVQTENERNDVTAGSVTGVHLQQGSVGNEVALVHGGVGTPIRDEGKANKIGHRATEANILQDSLLGGAPWGIEDTGPWHPRKVDPTTGPLSTYNTSANVSLNATGAFVFSTTGVGGETESIDTGGQHIGGQEGPQMTYAEITFPTAADISNVIFRLGVYNDASNFCMVEYDDSVASTFQLRSADGGRSDDVTDTGVTPNAGTTYAITCVRNQSGAENSIEGYCSIGESTSDNRPIVAESTADTSSWANSNGDDFRIEAESTSTSGTLRAFTLGYGGTFSDVNPV